MMRQPKALKNSKKAWAGIALFSLAFISASAGFSSSAAAGEKIQHMVYDVYAGGFHVVQANLKIDKSKKGRYSLNMEASTFGFLGRVAPWKGEYESYGWAMNNKIQPERHQSTATWRDEEETHTYNYFKNGNFKNYLVKKHEKPQETKKVDDELTKNSADSLTAALRVMMSVADGKPCTGSSEVFDGKRRFKQNFQDQGEKILKASKYNIYGGKARECIVEVVPVAGKWRDKPRGWMSIQEQGRERGMMPTLWMANMSDGAPAVPVKIRVKTAYGTLFMHLSEYRYGDELLIAEKRKD